MFSLRIVTVDHYLSSPIKDFDVCYSDFRKSEVNKVPIIRVFGVTPMGQKACLHIHGIFPYLTIPYDSGLSDDQSSSTFQKYTQELSYNIDKSLNIASRNTSSNKHHVYKISLESRLPFYGYHEKEELFLKIYFYNPVDVKRTMELLSTGLIMNKVIQPFEAHIPFILQFFIDCNLFGMNLINVTKIMFRPQDDSYPYSLSMKLQNSINQSFEGSFSTKVWDLELIKRMDMASSIDKQSTCELEADCCVTDILNRTVGKGKNGKNPGLLAIWEEERQRRRNKDMPSQITPISSQERKDVMTKSEVLYKEKLLHILSEVNTEGYSDVSSTKESSSVGLELNDQKISKILSQENMRAEDSELLSMVLSLINNSNQSFEHHEDDDSILSLKTPQSDENEEEEEEETLEMSQCINDDEHIDVLPLNASKLEASYLEDGKKSDITDFISQHSSHYEAMLFQNQPSCLSVSDQKFQIPQLDGAADLDDFKKHKSKTGRKKKPNLYALRNSDPEVIEAVENSHTVANKSQLNSQASLIKNGNSISEKLSSLDITSDVPFINLSAFPQTSTTLPVTAVSSSGKFSVKTKRRDCKISKQSHRKQKDRQYSDGRKKTVQNEAQTFSFVGTQEISNNSIIKCKQVVKKISLPTAHSSAVMKGGSAKFFMSSTPNKFENLGKLKSRSSRSLSNCKQKAQNLVLDSHSDHLMNASSLDNTAPLKLSKLPPMSIKTDSKLLNIRKSLGSAVSVYKLPRKCKNNNGRDCRDVVKARETECDQSRAMFLKTSGKGNFSVTAKNFLKKVTLPAYVKGIDLSKIGQERVELKRLTSDLLNNINSEHSSACSSETTLSIKLPASPKLKMKLKVSRLCTRNKEHHIFAVHEDVEETKEKFSTANNKIFNKEVCLSAANELISVGEGEKQSDLKCANAQLDNYASSITANHLDMNELFIFPEGNLISCHRNKKFKDMDVLLKPSKFHSQKHQRKTDDNSKVADCNVSSTLLRVIDSSYKKTRNASSSTEVISADTHNFNKDHSLEPCASEFVRNTIFSKSNQQSQESFEMQPIMKTLGRFHLQNQFREGSQKNSDRSLPLVLPTSESVSKSFKNFTLCLKNKKRNPKTLSKLSLKDKRSNSSSSCESQFKYQTLGSRIKRLSNVNLSYLKEGNASMQLAKHYRLSSHSPLSHKSNDKISMTFVKEGNNYQISRIFNPITSLKADKEDVQDICAVETDQNCYGNSSDALVSFSLPTCTDMVGDDCSNSASNKLANSSLATKKALHVEKCYEHYEKFVLPVTIDTTNCCGGKLISTESYIKQPEEGNQLLFKNSLSFQKNIEVSPAIQNIMVAKAVQSQMDDFSEVTNTHKNAVTPIPFRVQEKSNEMHCKNEEFEDVLWNLSFLSPCESINHVLDSPPRCWSPEISQKYTGNPYMEATKSGVDAHEMKFDTSCSIVDSVCHLSTLYKPESRISDALPVLYNSLSLVSDMSGSSFDSDAECFPSLKSPVFKSNQESKLALYEEDGDNLERMRVNLNGLPGTENYHVNKSSSYSSLKEFNDLPEQNLIEQEFQRNPCVTVFRNEICNETKSELSSGTKNNILKTFSNIPLVHDDCRHESEGRENMNISQTNMVCDYNSNCLKDENKKVTHFLNNYLEHKVSVSYESRICSLSASSFNESIKLTSQNKENFNSIFKTVQMLMNDLLMEIETRSSNESLLASTPMILNKDFISIVSENNYADKLSLPLSYNSETSTYSVQKSSHISCSSDFTSPQENGEVCVDLDFHKCTSTKKKFGLKKSDSSVQDTKYSLESLELFDSNESVLSNENLTYLQRTSTFEKSAFAEVECFDNSQNKIFSKVSQIDSIMNSQSSKAKDNIIKSNESKNSPSYSERVSCGVISVSNQGIFPQNCDYVQSVSPEQNITPLESIRENVSNVNISPKTDDDILSKIVKSCHILGDSDDDDSESSVGIDSGTSKSCQYENHCISREHQLELSKIDETSKNYENAKKELNTCDQVEHCKSPSYVLCHSQKVSGQNKNTVKRDLNESYHSDSVGHKSGLSFHDTPNREKECTQTYEFSSYEKPLHGRRDRSFNESPIQSFYGDESLYELYSVAAWDCSKNSSNLNIKSPINSKTVAKVSHKEQIVSHANKNVAKSCIWMPQFQPPSREEVENTYDFFNIPQERHQEAFFSNPGDVNSATKTVGYVSCAAGNKTCDLKDFNVFHNEFEKLKTAGKCYQSDATINPSSSFCLSDAIQQNPNLRIALAGNRQVVLTPACFPPLRENIETWLLSYHANGNLIDNRCTDRPNSVETVNPDILKAGSMSPVILNHLHGLQLSAGCHNMNPSVVISNFSDTRTEDISHCKSSFSPSTSLTPNITLPEYKDFKESLHSVSTPISVSQCNLLKKNRNRVSIHDEKIAEIWPREQSKSGHIILNPSHNRISLSPIIPMEESGLNHVYRKRKLFDEDNMCPEYVQKFARQDIRIDFQKELALYKNTLHEDHQFSSSQIEGPTVENTGNFKMALGNIGNARAMHEVQYLTTMSLEVHINTRMELRPNPEYDMITSIYYYIYNDAEKNSNRREEVLGVIAIDDNSNRTPCINCTSNEKCISCVNYGNQFLVTNDVQGVVCDKKNHDFSTCSEFLKQSTMSVSKLKSELSLKYGVFDVSVTFVENENSLFGELTKVVKKWDPDILVGYEIQMLSWGYLLQRSLYLGINLNSELSRISESGKDSNVVSDVNHSMEFDEYGAGHSSEIHITGRIVLNVWRIMRKEVTLNRYSFENVFYHVLHQRTPQYSFHSLTSWYRGRPRERWKVIDYYAIRTWGTSKMLEKLDIIARTSELARVFGIQFYDVLNRGSQFRVESMMLRSAKSFNYIPVSPTVRQRAGSRAPECVALILEPESKFYTNPVVVLDFQSLYPSMIIAYNYCFSTCLGHLEHLGRDTPFEFGCTSLTVPAQLLKKLQNDIHVSPTGIAFVKSHVRQGILPLMLDEILRTRIVVKQSMKECADDKTMKKLLDARQLGLKLIANVTYGYTAANFSGRMPCVEVADSIVGKARETLERSIHVVEDNPKWKAKVVYGDTDSMFILLPGRSKEQAFKIGAEIAEAVTNSNPKPVKLKFEKVYLPCVLQAKKRYVGFMYETSDQKEPIYDAKGIETVRRDTCPAVSKILEKSLKILFKSRDVSLVKMYVQKQFEKLLSGRTSPVDLIFAKEFRGSSGYRSGACVPALEIAKRRLIRDPRSEPHIGERVPYVIVYGFPNLPLIQLVREPDELLKDPSLRVNAKYYINRAIIPPLERVFSLIGTNVKNWYVTLSHSYVSSLPSNFSTKQQKATLSQYFSTLSCPVCESSTNTSVCASCQQNPQLTCTVLNDKIRQWERMYYHLSKVCCSCAKSVDGADQCISTDCPILFRRNHAAKDLSQAPYIRNILMLELF